VAGAVLDDQLYERCFRIKAKVVYLNHFIGLRSAPALLYLILVQRSDALWIGNCEKITFASVNTGNLVVGALSDRYSEGGRKASATHANRPIANVCVRIVLHENAELTQCYGVTRYDP